MASQFNLGVATSTCLLLCLFDEAEIIRVFNNMSIDSHKLKNKILSDYELKKNNTTFIGESDYTSVAFSSECDRIIKLSVLERKIVGEDVHDSIVLLLAILHDRANLAKEFLLSNGITYENVRKAMYEKLPASDYSFTDDEEKAQSPDEDGSTSATTQQQEQFRKSPNGTPVIDNFSTDLTALARKGSLDPVVGRGHEISRIMQILCRRKKNNPIIIGEPGVGKSAIVEGLAQRIVQYKVPAILCNKRVVSLNLTSLVAGTQYRGQFEERVRRLTDELKAHPEIILFIDEIHTIIGAGSAAGSLDAANILKPALARGAIQCIGATTTSEFKKTIEKDGALNRRFQKILLEPTSAEDTLNILHNIKSRYESHHNVHYTDEALQSCVELTNRYITERALPDKAIDALDEAGSRKHLTFQNVPKEIEEKEHEIESVRKQKFEAARQQNYELAANLRDSVAQMTIELEKMTKAWQDEQKANPTTITADDVAEVVSLMSGVPATRVASSENERLKGMKEALGKRVIAQDKAIERLTRSIIRNRIGLKGNDRPIGTFLFVGPTGVGKTHLVKCLAEWMFGTKDSLIRIDMSEFGEKFSVSRLLGAPPGYVGYEEGGQLTEQVRRHPYSVVLLDEIEKAHGDVFNTLLQVMDEGRLTDGNGTTIDFRNTIIIMTSNSGTRQLREFGQGVGFSRNSGEISSDMAESIVKKALSKQFAPEFLNRLDDIIMFNPINRDTARDIAVLETNILTDRLSQNGWNLRVTDEAIDHIVNKGFDPQYGARSLKRAIQHEIEDALCDFIMEHAESKDFTASVQDGKIRISTALHQEVQQA